MKTSELETALMLMGFIRGVSGGKNSMFLFYRIDKGYVRVELKRSIPLGRYQAQYWGGMRSASIGAWTKKSLLQAVGVLIEEMKEEIREYHQRIESVLENLAP